MNQEQMHAAQEAMTQWLSHPAELGKAPAKIECAGEFACDQLHYYIFKYKKGLWGKWLLGVCGGYEEDSLEHCGHVFSEMEEYKESVAVEQARALVEKVCQYYREQAQWAENRKENPGTFANYVLLREARWDKAALLQELKETWGIADESDDQEKEEESFVIAYQGAMIAVSMMPAPIPGGEAEGAAAKNYLWPTGVEQTKKHQAHLLVAVLGQAIPPVEGGQLLVKAVTSACKQEGVLGVYTGEVVYALDYWMNFSQMLKENEFPIYNLVWFGLYKGKAGNCGYTAGMRNFGYDEIEVLDSRADAETLHEFLSDIANYVILAGVVLNHGETIGFSEDQKLPITKSRGVAVEGESVKIGF
ncbi:MAG: DUF4261 domain-containing protein [Lachnospiraceae bacterium]|nr:DUF4261 domain-containing protein [Lachnospiraceae bacterium]